MDANTPLDTRMLIGTQISVDNGIGNAVTNLVRMSFRYGFASKKVVGFGHDQ